jgi:hypothetical protein
MTHARNFLKVGSTYGATEEVRFANTLNALICNHYRWHWLATAGQTIALSSSVQDYTMDSADQNKVNFIQDAYVSDATLKYPRLIVEGNMTLPPTDTTGRPVSVGQINTTQVRFWPAPNGTYTFNWRYHRRGTIYAANTETWDVPGAFDGLVKTGIIWQLLAYQDDTRQADYAKLFYKQLDDLRVSEERTSGRIR